MVVLVTGGAGFIGANLVKALLKQGAKIHLLQKKSSDLWRLAAIQQQLVFHHQELGERKSLTRLLKKIQPQIIYHLAAYGNYPWQTRTEMIVATNILGTLNLLIASQKVPYRCLVNTGSSSEYGRKTKPMREDDFCQPVSFYGASKVAATVFSQVFAQAYQKPIVTFRPFSVYGPYEDGSRFIPTAMLSLLNGRAIKLTAGKIRHDFIYVDDLVRAYLQAPKKIKSLSGRVINLGSGQKFTNDEVIATLFKVTGKKVEIQLGAYAARSWDTSHWQADTALAKKLLYWQPRFSFEKGLLQTFQWFSKNQFLYGKKN